MSEDEVIRFEITDQDLDNEFYPNRHRKSKKEYQIYGVWAKDSDEEDNEDNVRQRSRKAKDFSAPIGFVAGGVQQAGKKKEEAKELEASAPSTSKAIAVDSSDEEPSMPDETETAGIRRHGQGMRPVHLGANVGSWEKHTKGIGAKLLLQMGYEPGKGLGKDLQGISAPVEASVRKGRGAIGAYGPEKAALKAKKEEEKRKLKEEQEKEESTKSYNWKKSHKGRYFYRDSADVIQEGKPALHTATSSQLSRVPVIDMTGRERRVLSGYHALRAAAPRFEHEPRRECRNFDAPHLARNLDAVLECCEQDIIQNARELQAAEDELVVLQRDLDHYNEVMLSQAIGIARVEDILSRVEALEQPDVSLEAAFEILYQMKEQYPMEYEMYTMGVTAGNVVRPLISALMATWKPQQNPEEHLNVFLKWRPLLVEEAYYRLLWNHYVLTLEKQDWNPRIPGPMLRALTSWSEALPSWMAVMCAERCVVRRLLDAVRIWDPTKDTQPVHQWVLPWHDLAGEALATSVYPLIRSRLAAALTAWHPADGSARPLLAAWQQAWGGALTAMLHQYIVPKLEHCLQAAPLELVGREENTAWLWCLDWTSLLGTPSLGALAGRALLPRWLSAFAAWLNTNPPHATVLSAYTKFKTMFPDDVAREPAVRDAFRKALDMMNRSADMEGLEAPPAPTFNPSPPELPETSRGTVADALIMMGNKSFSELLESKCTEKGITYLPLPGKRREGRPIYRIGNNRLQCYVIRNVIMYSEDNGKSFAPIGLMKLISMVE